jgi:hypothetical protein
VSVWARRGEDVIEWVKPAATPTALWTTMNISRVDYRGVEGQVGAGRIALHGSYLDFDAGEMGTGFVGKYALRPITQAVGVRVGIVKGLSVDARHERRAGDAESHLNAGVHAVLRVKGVRLGVHGENLAGEDYLDVAGKPIAGRSLSVSLGWR